MEVVTSHGRERRHARMKVATILAVKGSATETISPAATVERAAQRLRSARIGALVVSSDGVHVAGLISERDIVHAFAKFGRSLCEMHVRDVMTQSPPTCTPDETVHDLMARMTTSRNRHVPVVVDGALAGIVSIGDVVKSEVDEHTREVMVLRDMYLARR